MSSLDNTRRMSKEQIHEVPRHRKTCSARRSYFYRALASRISNYCDSRLGSELQSAVDDISNAWAKDRDDKRNLNLKLQTRSNALAEMNQSLENQKNRARELQKDADEARERATALQENGDLKSKLELSEFRVQEVKQRVLDLESQLDISKESERKLNETLNESLEREREQERKMSILRNEEKQRALEAKQIEEIAKNELRQYRLKLNEMQKQLDGHGNQNQTSCPPESEKLTKLHQENQENMRICDEFKMKLLENARIGNELASASGKLDHQMELAQASPTEVTTKTPAVAAATKELDATLATGIYYFNPHFMSWEMARSVCRSKGMDLVAIESPEENEAIVTHARTLGEVTFREMDIPILNQYET
ncbi:hypothetical protein B566_EDAN010075 [Ephemera danica]|nr:hypothetical protein B566_EDAN010075 [Ephemera danica]